MNITLVRYRNKYGHIDGQLKTDQDTLCDTVENAEFAIPVGTYQIRIIKCKQHSRKQPVIIVKKTPDCEKCTLLESVNNNTDMPLFCPQITCGNGVYNRKDGAIIVGTYLAHGCLAHPQKAFKAIYDRLRKSAERGHDITLEIVEADPKANLQRPHPISDGPKGSRPDERNSLTI